MLGRPDRPHAPLANSLEQLVPAGDNGGTLLAHRDVPRRSVRVAVYWPVDHVTSVIVRPSKAAAISARRCSRSLSMRICRIASAATRKKWR